MAGKLALTLACGDYEIIRAIKEGEVKADGIELNVLTQMDSTTRHWRFLRNGDFDVAECSASAFITGVAQQRPLAALPVFLHRRFRHGFIFINKTKSIFHPKDLIGKRIGVKSFQITAGVWCRGILENEYGIPSDQVEWVTERDEDVDFQLTHNFKVTKIPDSYKSLDDMLADGEIDAMFAGAFPKCFLAGHPNVGRLFENYEAEEEGFFRKTGVFPIMHVLCIKPKIIEKHPWVTINLFKAFERAKDLAMKRMENPRIVPLAWYRGAWERQRAILGHDPWEYGLSDINQSNINMLTSYLHQQGITSTHMKSAELFLPVSQGRRRGEDNI
jgi:4,5-dihydroxyphthalate decarboxylase